MATNYYKESTDRRTIPIIRLGEVVSNVDSKRAGLVKARITGIDVLENDQSLIECVPLLPKFLSVMPKVGESIFIFQYEDQKGDPTSKFNSKRFWLGPLIAQPTKLSDDPSSESNAILPDGWTKLKDPNLEEGAYGNSEDIILQGRYNTDLIQKDREIWIRVGKFIEGENNKFNRKDLGYLQLKYGGEKLKRTLEDKEISTFIPPKPTVILNVELTTYITGNIALSNDLPPDRYKDTDVEKTVLKIQKKDVNTGELTTILPEQTFTKLIHGNNTRNAAINKSKTPIDDNKGEKWKIRCTAPDLLNSYPHAEKGVAVFSVTPTEIKKTIKQTKFVAAEDKKSSVINVVANKINLLSHDGEHNFELANPKYLITEEEQEIINSDAHPLVYGDKLVEFLELVRKYINLHVHPYHGLPADNAANKLDVLRFDLETILNHNINSN